MEKVSVIIPVYKVEPYLRQCLDSVINQTYYNLEIIVIDDGSPDNCGVICDEYAMLDARICVVHRTNAGVGAARNTGIDMATGDWITFIDSDDWIESEYIEKMMMLGESQKADIICSGGYIRERNGRDNCIQRNVTDLFYYGKKEDYVKWEKLKVRTLGYNTEDKNFNKKGSLCYVWDKFYKTAFLKSAEITMSEYIHPYEDNLFNFEVFDCADSVLGSPYIGYHYRENKQSVMHRSQPHAINMYLQCLDVLNEYISQSKQSDIVNHAYRRFVLSSLCSALGRSVEHEDSCLTDADKRTIYNTIKGNKFVQEAWKSHSWRYLSKKIILLKLLLRIPGGGWSETFLSN